MRGLLWSLCILSVAGIFYADDIHAFLLTAKYYQLPDKSIIQVILAVAAGIFATKASDSSREIKALLKIDKIDRLLGEAQSAEETAKTQKERLNQIEKLLTSETEAEFARDMIIRHREQLEYHWQEILKLESLIVENAESLEDTELKNRVRAYLIKSRYIDYMGRGFLRSIPFIGSILHMIFGPIWDEYYYRNMQKINTMLRATANQTNDEK